MLSIQLLSYWTFALNSLIIGAWILVLRSKACFKVTVNLNLWLLKSNQFVLECKQKFVSNLKTLPRDILFTKMDRQSRNIMAPSSVEGYKSTSFHSNKWHFHDLSLWITVVNVNLCHSIRRPKNKIHDFKYRIKGLAQISQRSTGPRSQYGTSSIRECVQPSFKDQGIEINLVYFKVYFLSHACSSSQPEIKV